MMSLDRRGLIKAGASCAAAAAAMPALAGGHDRGAVEAVLVDTRYAASARAAAAFGPALRLTTDGDVTRLWTDHLDRAWRSPGGLLAGTSGTDVLFVLATLAHDRGRRIVRQAGAGGGLVRWTIGMRG